MAEPNIRQMFEAGVHFGHQSRFWNPQMAPYIYGERNKIHIIDLDAALPMFKSALGYLKTVSASGGKILFVGTKRAARESIVKHARACGMPYVNHRWLGGMLTNFKMVRLSVNRYIDLEEERGKGEAVKLSKKMALRRDREIAKSSRTLEGIKDMVRVPDAMFVIDVGYEKIAVNEAAKLGIPVIAMVDTNNSFENVDYMVPGNDDAIRAVDLYVSAAADAILQGIREKEAELASVQSMAEIKGVIKVPPKAADDGKAKEVKEVKEAKETKIIGTLKKTDAKAGGRQADKKDKPKPKVRMRGLFKRLKGDQAESEGKDKTESKTEDRVEGKAESKTEGKIEGKAEDKAESKTEGKVEDKAESKTEDKAEGKIEGKAEDKAEGKIEGNAESKTEGKVESKTEDKTESKAEDKTKDKKTEANTGPDNG